MSFRLEKGELQPRHRIRDDKTGLLIMIAYGSLLLQNWKKGFMKIEFTLTRSDSKSATRIIGKLHPKRSWVNIAAFIGNFIGFLLVTASAVALAHSLKRLYRSAPEIVIGLCSLAIGLLIIFATVRYTKSLMVDKSGIYGSLFVWEVLEDRLVIWRNHNIKTEFFPGAILKVIQHGGFLLAYTGETSALYVPLRVFSDDSEGISFVEQLKQVTMEKLG